MSDTPTIAIDAMGGDYGPPETVRGAVLAARSTDVSVLLVGDETEDERTEPLGPCRKSILVSLPKQTDSSTGVLQ